VRRGLSVSNRYPEYYGEVFDRRRHLTVKFLICDEKTLPQCETFLVLCLLPNSYIVTETAGSFADRTEIQHNAQLSSTRCLHCTLRTHGDLVPNGPYAAADSRARFNICSLLCIAFSLAEEMGELHHVQ
jgi:hypothetical protein